MFVLKSKLTEIFLLMLFTMFVSVTSFMVGHKFGRRTVQVPPPTILNQEFFVGFYLEDGRVKADSYVCDPNGGFVLNDEHDTGIDL